MNLFAANLLLALAWVATSGDMRLTNLVFGFVLGTGALLLIREQVSSSDYVGRSFRVISLFSLFIYELVKSSIRVAWILMQPRLPLNPGFIAYPLRVNQDFEITLLANLITLTPGTLSVDVSPDRTTLYIHALDVPDAEELKREIAEGFERKILEAFR